jgi:hypothetical protein
MLNKISISPENMQYNTVWSTNASTSPDQASGPSVSLAEGILHACFATALVAAVASGHLHIRSRGSLTAVLGQRLLRSAKRSDLSPALQLQQTASTKKDTQQSWEHLAKAGNRLLVTILFTWFPQNPANLTESKGD